MIAKLAIDLRIAEKASLAELKMQFALGDPKPFEASYRVIDEILDIAGKPDRPAVWPRMKMIGNMTR